MVRFEPKPAGEFRNREYKTYFTFRPTTDEWAVQFGFAHEIDVLDGVRFGNVLKTVAHVCIDQDRFGLPVMEKWAIDQQKFFHQNI